MSKRGFAALDVVRQREIASKGGKAAHAGGKGHEFTSDEAKEAGRKGGKSHSREFMSRIAKMGAEARRKRAAAG